MVFTVDFLDHPITWSLTGTVDDPGWTAESHRDYRPTLYAVTARGMTETAPDAERCTAALQDLREALATHPAVATTRIERRRSGLRFAEQPVLAIEADRNDAVRDVARFVERRGPPGQHPFRTFDVDFSPEFRFCLDQDVSPTRPGRRHSSDSTSLGRQRPMRTSRNSGSTKRRPLHRPRVRIGQQRHGLSRPAIPLGRPLRRSRTGYTPTTRTFSRSSALPSSRCRHGSPAKTTWTSD
ncbi:hypothetical protein GJ629_15675 [Halapricum sp. CBA1109]|uniref:hypothetical protein n=1 Tax=Halapricum sp. CBA1109 TaxID=2668068 RepID=UPI0012F9CD7E|nr:hypothetical protein [Halapricum sp. CBA1109]MUV91148.1 hypothetical protein [Halapricum sp. CBA1109]